MIRTFISLTLIFCALSAFGYPAKVVSIIDGDTVHVLANNQDIKVRLFGIDAPERKQPYSAQSKAALAEKILGQTVEVTTHGTDRYRRTIADLYIGKRCINEEMVSEGWAWDFKRYSNGRFAGAEQKARKEKAGLWADPAPVAPWEFRK